MIPGEVRNMLRLGVCAAHGFSSPKFSQQGSFFGRFSLNMAGLAEFAENS